MKKSQDQYRVDGGFFIKGNEVSSPAKQQHNTKEKFHQ
jgi:hypothetical protein